MPAASSLGAAGPAVVVIGGGPAGSTAARLLATWGHAVTLLTRPLADETLAESLPPSCVHLLERLDLREAVDNAGFVRSTGNTVWWASGDVRVEPFAGGRSGYQVSRGPFDRLLLDLAREAGVAVHARCSAREVREPNGDGGARAVIYEDDGGEHRLSTPWVIDCTGRTGLTTRGWRVPDDATRTTALLGVWENPAGWSLPDWTHTTIESFAEGWAWSIPLSESQRVVTVMVDPRLSEIAGGARLEATYRGELAKAPRHRAQVHDARLVQPVWACDASPYHATRVSAPGLLVAGDAASFIDPLSSFGVKKALASAWLAAVVVNTALRAPERTGAALELFESREQEAHAALRARVVQVAQEMASSGGHRFWAERAEGGRSGAVTSGGASFDDTGEPDVEVLRRDPDVLAAFAELRRRDGLELTMTRSAGIVTRPTVRGNEVVLLEHLASPALPRGARYVRNIDLLALARIATECRQVPEVVDLYNRRHPAASLPDLLGALSVLIGRGVLEFP